MTSSPASTVTSSELYPTSEPVDQEAQTEAIHSPLGPRHRPSRSNLETQVPKFELSAGPGTGSKDLDEPQRLEAAGGDEANTISGSITDFSEASSGDFIRTGHKRKRGSDTECPRSIQGEPVFTDLVESLPYPNRIASVPSMSYMGGESDIRASTDELSSNKRIRSDDVAFGPITRVKYSSQWRDFPIGIWQHIFCFVPPAFLGRLLRVNRAFNACLTAGDANKQYAKPSHSGIIKTLNPDTVWAASRKRFCPGLPKPIRGLLELEMWRLLRGRHCQSCREIKDASSVVNSESPWESGPGESGVRVVWPWGVRLCGQCVQNHSEKVMIIKNPKAYALSLIFARRSTCCFHLIRACCQDFLLPSFHHRTTMLPVLLYGPQRRRRSCN